MAGHLPEVRTGGVLSERVQIAAAHLDDCHLCPHHCGPARADARGVCRVGRDSYIASEMLHLGEEALLRPAHAIFFSGCTATCSFCTAAKFAFHPTYGVTVSPRQLAARMAQRQDEGARSICFIGGDPAPHIPFILASLEELGARKRVPAVLNSNFYLTDTALDLLDGLIDIYLPDLKFGPARVSSQKSGDAESRRGIAEDHRDFSRDLPQDIEMIPARDGEGGCGERLGGMPDYWPVVTAAIDRVRASGATTGSRVIVRHLLMPGHFDCCTAPVLEWLAARPDLHLSLLTQYLAPAHVRGELAAPLDPDDIARTRQMATDYGLTLVV